MKGYFRLLFVAVASMLFWNCSKDQVDDSGDLKYCELSVESIVADGALSEEQFEVKTSDETMWRIILDSHHTWLNFSQTEGKGSATVVCTFDENPDQEVRTATMLFEAFLYGEPYFSKEIPIKQMTQAPYLTVDETLQEEGFKIAGEGITSQEIAVVSNVKWTVSAVVSAEDDAAVDWIHVDPASGSGKSSFSFSVDPNTTEADGRSAVIVIASEDGTLSVTVPVMQEFYDVQEVDGIVFNIRGMSAYLPEGEGKILVTSVVGSVEKEYPVSVEVISGNTRITVNGGIESGKQIIDKFVDSSGQEYVMGVEVEILPDELLIEVLGWDTHFKTFAGLTAENPILIGTEADLRLLATAVNGGKTYSGKYFKLNNDIDISSAAWTPIGSGTLAEPKPFSGIFDGDNKTITGMHFTTTGGFKGLFGVVSGADTEHKAEIRNIIMKGKGDGSYDVEVNGVTKQSGCGAIAGVVINYAVVSGCDSYLHMKLAANSAGIIGAVDNNNQGAVTYPKLPNGMADVIVEDCHNYGNIDANPVTNFMFNVAGIVASNMGIVRRCSNHGNISSLAGAKPFWQMGGIVAANNGQVLECYNTGAMNGGTNIGGIVAFGSGISENLVKDCYNTGDILAATVSSGGILGTTGNTAQTRTTIQNCYSIGNKSTESGGLFGTLQKGAALIIRFCASSQAKMVGSGSNNFASDTEQLETGDRWKNFSAEDMKKKATFTTSVWASAAPGWDFDSVWAIDEGSSTPYLRNNEQVPHPGADL